MGDLNRRSLLLLPGLALASPAWADGFPLAALMAQLGSVPERRARFTEQRHFAALTRTLESRGRLLYRRPDYLEKVTEWPNAERMVIDGARLIVTEPGNEPPQVVDLAAQPALDTLAEGMRGPLAGDAAALARAFVVTGAGTLDAWTLDLAPRNPEAARMLRRIRLAGKASWIGDIWLDQANGDGSWMRIEPA